MSAARTLTLSRLENLSDGVFGFAMTLLVLGLGVEDAFRLLEAGDVRAGLASMAPRFLTMAFGMFGLGAFWVAHNVQFRHVTTADRNLAFLNLLPLLFTIVLPFCIALWGRRWEDPAVIVIIVANLALINATLWAQWLYILRLRARHGDPIAPKVRRDAARAYLLPNFVWLGVALLAFVNALASVVVFVLFTLAYALPFVSRWVWTPRRRA